MSLPTAKRGVVESIQEKRPAEDVPTQTSQATKRSKPSMGYVALNAFDDPWTGSTGKQIDFFKFFTS